MPFRIQILQRTFTYILIVYSNDRLKDCFKLLLLFRVPQFKMVTVKTGKRIMDCLFLKDEIKKKTFLRLMLDLFQEFFLRCQCLLPFPFSWLLLYRPDLVTNITTMFEWTEKPHYSVRASRLTASSFALHKSKHYVFPHLTSPLSFSRPSTLTFAYSHRERTQRGWG